MHSAHRHGVLSLGALVVTLLFCACTEPGGNCLSRGECQCLSAEQCPEGEHCVNGSCQVVIGPDQGRRLFGEPCLSDRDCRSGFCLPGGPDNGQVCSRPCLDSACPDGWDCKSDHLRFSQALCVQHISSRLCQPCSVSSQCNAIGDLCLVLDGEFVCAQDCSLSDCPQGYVCQRLEFEGASLSQCQPEGGTCDCTPETIGLPRACVSTNELGSCPGMQVCSESDPQPQWSACDAPLPAQETCNGLDDDCDGLLDELDPGIDTSGLPDQPPYPSCQKGSSQANCLGRWHCQPDEQGQYAWVCGATDPEDEWCNGLDDNCDGQADEPFLDSQGNYVHLEHCGFCNTDCRQMVPHLLTDNDGLVVDGAVDCILRQGASVCAPILCQPGFYPFPEHQPATCARLVSPACQPCSSNADCRVSSDRCLVIGEDPGGFCAQSCEPTSHYVGCSGLVGEQSCCPEGYTCSQVAGERLCLPDSQSCTCDVDRMGQTRSCLITGVAGEVCQGEQTCLPQGDDFAWNDCQQSDVVIEVCDYLDNNCDGQADEGFVDAQGQYTTDEHCQSCNNDCTARWDRELQHAIGGCVVEPQPDHLSDSGLHPGIPPLLGPCRDDGDCASGQSCDETYHHCQPSCPAGDCLPPCTQDSDCTSLYGAGFRCAAGQQVCTADFQFENLNQLDADGCECARLTNAGPDQPDTSDTYPQPGLTYVDRDCDGVDGQEATALFVWSGLDQALGTREHPYQTLAQALSAYVPGQHQSILVAAGNYRENINLSDGVRLYGGYSHDFSTRDVVLYPAVLIGQEPDPSASNSLPGVVNGVGISSPTVFSGFVVQGYDVNFDSPSAQPGYSSYAVYLKDCSSELEISNNRILGGRGGDGSAGQPGQAGTNGNDGQDGTDSTECQNSADCYGLTNPGGPGGGNSNCGQAQGRPGASARGTNVDPQDYSGAGLDGAGGYNSLYGYFTVSPQPYCKYDCQVGGGGSSNNGGDARPGGQGLAGPAGSGCTQGAGTISGGLWRPATASAGQNGSEGNGGGGGGAGGAVENTNSSFSCSVGNPWGDLGGSGGGGGAGGCGASHGSPGGGGGGSFAIFIAQTSGNQTLPNIFGNHIRRGFGGRGGAGGGGGQGGLGGQGGQGGFAVLPAWCAGAGGHGGRGGDGGASGGSGGGCGGPSYGIAGQNISGSDLGAHNMFSVPGTTESGGPGGAGGPSPAGEQYSGGAGNPGAADDLGLF